MRPHEKTDIRVAVGPERRETAIVIYPAVGEYNRAKCFLATFAEDEFFVESWQE